MARNSCSMRSLATTSVGCALAISAPEPSWADEPAQLNTSQSFQSVTLAEVIVTATKRTESAQSVSVPIDVLGPRELERVDNADSLNSIVPGIATYSTNGYLTMNIRGVGSKVGTQLASPGTTQSVDGVSYYQSYTTNGQFFDLQRIEVLKGPQGTLYGRNSTGGSVNLISNGPSKDFGGYVDADFGNFDSKRVTAAVTGPVLSDLAARLAVHYESHDGYLTDGYNDQNVLSIRLRALWSPTDADSVNLYATYVSGKSKGDAAVVAPALDPAKPYVGPTDPHTRAFFNAIIPGLGDVAVANASQNIDSTIVSLQYDHDFGNMALTLIPAYVQSDLSGISETAIVVPTYNVSNSNTKSLELRLSSDEHRDSRLKWLVGAYAARESDYAIGQPDLSGLGVAVLPFARTLGDKTYAGFGDLTLSLTNWFRLVGGLRYTSEFLSLAGGEGLPVPGPLPAPNPTVLAVNESGARHDTALNYRAGIEIDVAPGSMLYSTVSTGFHAGGFNDDAPPNTYDPERLRAVEVGSKNDFWNRRLTLNLEAYHWDYTDKQEQYVTLNSEGIPAPLTRNAGAATLYGLETSLKAAITGDDVLTTSVSYNHTRFDRFSTTRYFTNLAPPDLGCTADAAVPHAPGIWSRVVDCSGRPLTDAPLWTLTAGWQHTQPLPGGSSLAFNVDFTYKTEQYVSDEFTAYELQRAYHNTDVSLSWISSNGQLRVEGYAKNLENSAVYTGAITLFPGIGFNSIAPPRLFGGRIRYDLK